jgi:hypothetical protein
MTMANKHNESQKQVQPGVIYHPMAVQEPAKDEQIEALILRLNAAEEWISQHNKYHFGGLYK